MAKQQCLHEKKNIEIEANFNALRQMDCYYKILVFNMKNFHIPRIKKCVKKAEICMI